MKNCQLLFISFAFAIDKKFTEVFLNVLLRKGRELRSIKNVWLIAGNISRRCSGINSTLERVVLHQNKQLGACVFGGIVSIASLKKMYFWDFWKLWVQPSGKPFRIWHARRNSDMVWGIIFRDLLRMPLQLVFTSASQRRQSKFTQFLTSKMTTVIATSSGSAFYLNRSSVVIPHGMDVDMFSPASHSLELRTRLGIPNGIVVGCFGRIRPSKGTDLFVDAILPLMRERDDVYALLTGLLKKQHSDFFQKISLKISQENLSSRFIWLGEVDGAQMPNFYRCLDLYVAPQRWEGFGVTPLEAMASGLPVVATRVGAFETQIIDGETGFLVAPNNADELRDRLNQMIQDRQKRIQMGKAARDHVVRSFGINREVKAIHSVYEAIWKSAPLVQENSSQTKSFWEESI